MDAPSRRTILTGAAAGLATVAGCAKYGEPKPTPQPAPADTVLGKTEDIPVGGGQIFAPQQVVVTQPVQGTFKAFSSICTHQSCPVASVASGTINCDCHGSKYSIKDGSVVNGPAPRPLPPKQIKISGDAITLT
ncbi:nitrite reductase/ring-hydroxylating ferredoxin subunit [Kribbella pratensis]|uniref:Cytochrome bc1 complex Rieske iron-sulfur subunit n=1 Tax=Kribbella pratensis TaxID=2512112 RepID=A0ABY2FJE5_9ACTN|nr:Rieske (2Fe-2S) protein [Kribbella pratensis]TDW92902.1 nitrite reductase/ring-hydroxylating ferredoxin subunit [Kribbella pratensis]